MTREDWLMRLADAVRPWFEDFDHTIPPVRISIGFPSTGRNSKRIGECWHSDASADHHSEIFIHPAMSDPMRIAGVVVHELCHAVLGPEAKHGPVFRKLATALGLEGKMTATTESDAFKHRIAPILDELGPYPGATLNALASGRKKQSTRLIKCECPQCGYTVRTTNKWLDLAVPVCPVDESEMAVGGVSEDSE